MEVAEDDRELPRLIGRELLVVIDGVTELERWGGLGLEPNDLLNPDLPLIPHDESTVDVDVQRCGCGELGCGALTVSIRRVGDTIEWTNARDGSQRFAIGPFQFEATAYEAEIRRAHEDRPWESRSDHVARLVAEQLRHLRDGRPLSVGWVVARAPDLVEVSGRVHRPNPKAGQPQGPRHEGSDGWFMQAVEPDEISKQHVGQFEILDSEDAETAASRIVHEVATSDPSSWRRSRRRPPP